MSAAYVQAAKRAALVETIRRALTAEACEIHESVSTGGGCHAMLVKAPDGREVYITDGDSQLPYDDPDTSSLVFSYYDEGDYEGTCLLTSSDAEKVAATVQAWAAGHPYLDMR